MLRSLTVVLLCLTPLVAASAQSESSFAAYAAILIGPVGAHAPAAPVTSAESGSPSFTVRYGHHNTDEPLRAYAARLETGVGRGRLGFTLGANTCSGCDEVYQLGVDWLVPLYDHAVRFGLRPALGLARGSDDSETAWTLALGAPLAVPLHGETGPVFMPYIEPAFALAGFTGSDGDSGSRAMLGGGMFLGNRAGSFGVTLGVQKVFIDGGETTFGLGLTFGRARP